MNEMEKVNNLIKKILKIIDKEEGDCNIAYIAIQAIRLHLDDDLKEEFKIINKKYTKKKKFKGRKQI